jgi:formylglycine-generating enzyme required for sulfatase activity
MQRKFLGLLIVTVSLSLAGCSNPSSDGPDDQYVPKSTNADLASLTADSGTLNPAFTAEQTEYTVIAANTVTSINLGGVTADPKASVSVSPAQPTQVSVGANLVTATVTAEDGTTTKKYTIIVYKNGPTPADYTSPSIASLKLKGVPAGAFQRDSTVTNTSAVSAFRMSEKEITRAQFVAILGTDPSVAAYSSSSTFDPVQGLSWYEAITFCNKLSLADSLTPVYSVTGVNFSTLTHAGIPTANDSTWNAVSADWSASGYRLPTETEWMWAAMGATAGSAGRTKAFAGSTGTNEIGLFAVFGYGGTETGMTTTQRSNQVGSKCHNELGIFDLSGNVAELIWDWYAYPKYPTGALSDYKGPATGTQRLKKGGSWMESSSHCAIAYWEAATTSSGYMLDGFRVVRRGD